MNGPCGVRNEAGTHPPSSSGASGCGCRQPAYAPDLNPAEGIWSLLKRAMVNFAAADLAGLVRIVKRKLKKIQYRPHLIDGCLAGTGLTIDPWQTTCTTSSTWLAGSKMRGPWPRSPFDGVHRVPRSEH